MPRGHTGTNATLLDIPVLPSKGVAASAHAKLDLCLTLSGERVFAEFMAELFDESTISRMLGSFVRTLQQAVNLPLAPALGASLLGSEERELIAGFSCGPSRPEYTDGPLFHEAVAAVAACQPAGACLVYEGATMSYAEVAAAASDMAGALSLLGIGPGSMVGVMLERSFDLVIAILGVLHAGGEPMRVCWLACALLTCVPLAHGVPLCC